MKMHNITQKHTLLQTDRQTHSQWHTKTHLLTHTEHTVLRACLCWSYIHSYKAEKWQIKSGLINHHLQCMHACTRLNFLHTTVSFLHCQPPVCLNYVSASWAISAAYFITWTIQNLVWSACYTCVQSWFSTRHVLVSLTVHHCTYQMTCWWWCASHWYKFLAHNSLEAYKK